MISTLKAATRKRTRKVRSISHTGQYAGSISPDHSQGQTLVKPLALPGITRHINKFLCNTTQKRGSGLDIHTSGLNCHWLQVEIALEVMIFLAFYDLSFCSPKTSLSGGVLIVAPEQKCPQLLCPTPGSGLCTRDPKSGHLASFDR